MNQPIIGSSRFRNTIRAMQRCVAIAAVGFVSLAIFAPRLMVAGKPASGTSAAGGALLHPNASVQLCGIIGCPTPPPPIITQVNPASVMKPGGAVLLRGTNFMGANGGFGKVALILSPPAGVLVLPRDLSGADGILLENAQWGDTAAYGIIPSWVSGVTDQPPTFKILRSDGVTSAPFTPSGMRFTATRTVSTLPAGDVQVLCSQAADQNQCNGWADYTPPESVSGTVVSVHNAFLTNEHGHDDFIINLINGWVVHNTDPADLTMMPGCDYFNNMGYDLSSSGQTEVAWTADPSAGRAFCVQWVFISGPVGVPWKK